MEYIECTHCGKRYAVSDKVSNSEGDFVRCKQCSEKFMIVIQNSGLSDDPKEENINATGDWDPTLTESPQPKKEDPEPEQQNELEIADDHESPSEESVIDWDPSLTMPVEQVDEESEQSVEVLSDEEVQAKAAEALLKIQQEKKKKMITYGLLVIVGVLLSLTLYMALVDQDIETLPTAPVVKRLSPQELDAQNLDCRMVAAKQWLLDYKAMHKNYSAQDFMDMIEQSQSLEKELKTVCKSRTLSKSILDAATEGTKPEWFAAEIQKLIYQ